MNTLVKLATMFINNGPVNKNIAILLTSNPRGTLTPGNRSGKSFTFRRRTLEKLLPKILLASCLSI